MHQEVIPYWAAGANCHGTICYNNSVPGKKPAVLIVHAFEGKTDTYVEQAKKIAQESYVGIAIDMQPLPTNIKRPFLANLSRKIRSKCSRIPIRCAFFANFSSHLASKLNVS
jgi:hypothetical protein